MRRFLRGLATLAIFVAGLSFLVLALGGHLQLLDARKLMAEGRLAEGTITELRGRGGKSTSYYFNYEFFVGGIAHGKQNVGLSFSDYRSLQRGNKIQVRYDARNPAKSTTALELTEFESWPNRLFLPGVALALLGWWLMRIIRRRPPPPAPPATPEPARYVSPVRRGE